jgi:F0F1-type ATP synthase assembly protein I
MGFRILRAHRRKTAFRATFFGSTDIEREPGRDAAIDAELQIRQAMARLDRIDREALMLREFEQLSYAEIAELLGVPVNTVRSRLFRARFALREILIHACFGHQAPRNRGTPMNIAPHTVSPEEVMAFLDGELAPEEANALSYHLEECPQCAYVAEQFREMSRSIAKWEIEAPPAKAEDAIFTTVAVVKTRNPLWMRPWVLASAGSMAAALLVVFGVQSHHRTDEYKMHAYMRPEAQSVNGSMATPAPPPIPRRADATYTDSISATSKVAKEQALYDYDAQQASAKQATRGGGGGGSEHVAELILQQPMIARTVALTIQVKDFAASRAAVDAIVTRFQGYPATLTANTPEGTARTLQASLRIPAPQLAAALNELKRLGRVQNETQSGEEVTQQHADLVARLKNSRETEERLQAILQQRTGKIEDVLQVEEEIARVRGEIESMEADQQALEHRVAFASVDLQLTEDYKEPLSAPDASTGNRLHNAFVSGWRNAAGFLLGIVLLAAESGPTLLLILLLLGLPAFLFWRRYRKLRGIQ